MQSYVILSILLGVACAFFTDPYSWEVVSHQVKTRNELCAHSRSSNQKFCCHEHGLGCTEELLPLQECASEMPKLPAKPFCCQTYNVGCAQPGELCASSAACHDSTCVFEDLSNTDAGGICKQIDDRTEECSIDYCSRKGAQHECFVPHTGVSTCAAWHSLQVELGTQVCAIPCSKICLAQEDQPVGSDGMSYCSECQLRAASCESGFTIYGPVDELSGSPEPEETPEPMEVFCFARTVSKFDAFDCCTTFGTACPKEGEKCSSGGSLTKPPPCDGELTCVLTDFGYPALDVADEGTCEMIPEGTGECSLEYCVKNGSEALCGVSDRLGTMSTCGAWQSRSDSEPAANCEIECPVECETNGPVGSDGETYCNQCEFMTTSCVSGYEIYGPVEN